jgi:hypothetical protein
MWRAPVVQRSAAANRTSGSSENSASRSRVKPALCWSISFRLFSPSNSTTVLDQGANSEAPTEPREVSVSYIKRAEENLPERPVAELQAYASMTSNQ